MIRLKDIRNFLEGNTYKLLDNTGNVPRHIKEQALYRALLCMPCLKNGKCTVCKCKTPNMFYAPNKVDSKGRWGKMLSPEDWEVYKASQEFKELFPDGIPEETAKRHEKENSLRLKIRRTDAST